MRSEFYTEEINMSDREVTIKVPVGTTVVVSKEDEPKEEQKNQSGPQILTEDLPCGYCG